MKKPFIRLAYLNMSVAGTKCLDNFTLRQDGLLMTSQCGAIKDNIFCHLLAQLIWHVVL